MLDIATDITAAKTSRVAELQESNTKFGPKLSTHSGVLIPGTIQDFEGKLTRLNTLLILMPSATSGTATQPLPLPLVLRVVVR